MNTPALGVVRALVVLLSIIPVVAGANAPDQAAGWQTNFTDLRIEIDPGRGWLSGEARLCLERRGSGAGDIFLELNQTLSVLTVTNGTGRPLAFRRSGEGLIVHGGSGSAGPGKQRIRIGYQGPLAERVPALDFFNARIGPAFAHALYPARWYPQLPGPARRSCGRLSFRVPPGWTVASVGRLTAERKLPSGNQVDFSVRRPVLYGFAAAPFRALRRKVEGQEVGVFLLGGSAEKAASYLANCSRIIRFLKNYYGPFPYEGYSVIEFPPELLGAAGGGSYESLTLFSPAVMPDRFFSAHVFGHEIAHLWWGGAVQGVEGPVINEGLAQFSTALYLEHAFGETAFRRILKNGAPELLLVHSARSYFQALQSPPAADHTLLGLLHRGEDLALGVPAVGNRDTLHMLANSKGCFVFVMLRDLIGAEALRRGLRGALARFAWRNLALDDLRREWEKASGRDLHWFFDQWFFRPGAPEFSMSSATEAQGANWAVKGRIRQLRDVYRVTAEIVFVKGGVRETKTVEIGAAQTEFSVLLPFKPDAVRFDPDYKILRWSDEFKTQ